MVAKDGIIVSQKVLQCLQLPGWSDCMTVYFDSTVKH
jgi:hypothetical protein